MKWDESRAIYLVGWPGSDFLDVATVMRDQAEANGSV